MIDDRLRHYLPGGDPLDLTIHQTLLRLENVMSIETEKAGETNHRASVERVARRARLTDG